MFQLENISKHGVDEINIIKEEAKKFNDIEAIYLFGSCAYKKDRLTSDIDTLIIWNGSNDPDRCGLQISKFIENVFNRKAFRWDRLYIDSIEQFNNKDYGVYEEIKQLNNIIYKKGE